MVILEIDPPYFVTLPQWWGSARGERESFRAVQVDLGLTALGFSAEAKMRY
jgi:hypothetical protein